jgi:hypothetical protein
MMTFTQLYSRAADVIGVSIATDSQDLTNLKQDINQGLRLFKNAARRYTTRKEVTADLVAGQQYYTFPGDLVRASEIRVNSSGLNFPVLQVDSEAMWNRINIIPAMTINLPMYYFIRGRNEIGLWPVPSQNQVAGIVTSYEPRMSDMVIDDTTSITVNVVNGSTTVIAASGTFLPTMVGMSFSVTDGTDGNWYVIIAQNGTTLTLENVYQGVSENAAPSIIASLPDIPEEYHIALLYYAAFNFYLKRNELATSNNFNGLFEGYLVKYKDTYAAKTTGQVLNSIEDYRYSIFTLPPNPLS